MDYIYNSKSNEPLEVPIHRHGSGRLKRLGVKIQGERHTYKKNDNNREMCCSKYADREGRVIAPFIVLHPDHGMMRYRTFLFSNNYYPSIRREVDWCLPVSSLSLCLRSCGASSLRRKSKLLYPSFVWDSLSAWKMKDKRGQTIEQVEERKEGEYVHAS